MLVSLNRVHHAPVFQGKEGYVMIGSPARDVTKKGIARRLRKAYGRTDKRGLMANVIKHRALLLKVTLEIPRPASKKRK